MELSFILNELGEERENYFNAVSPPIIQSSNFAFKTVSTLRQAMADEFDANLYSRGQNPTLNILRKKLAALDGAEDALVFSSGIAAISVPLLSLLKTGDHIITQCYPVAIANKNFKVLNTMIERYPQIRLSILVDALADCPEMIQWALDVLKG